MMTIRKNFASGSPWEPLRGFSRAVQVGNALHISGTTAQVASGEVVGGTSAYEQTRFTLEQIKRIVHGAGFQLADIVRTRLMVTNLSDFAEYARAHQEFFEAIRPASSIVQVVRLVDPRLLVEIEAEAIRGGSDPYQERLSLLDDIGSITHLKKPRTLSIDKRGKPVSKGAIEAVVRVLIEISAADNDVAAVEVGTIVDVLTAYFEESESLIPALVESVLERASTAHGIGEVFDLLTQVYSEAQRLTLLALCWRLILADGKVESAELQIAEELRKGLGLTPQQEFEARELAQQGEV